MNVNSPPQVEIFDTSLRDGMQQPNLDISVPNAVNLIRRMSTFGVHTAEIGFAGAYRFVEQLSKAVYDIDTGAMKLALFGRTRGRGMRVADWPDARFMVERRQRVPVAVIVVKSRLLDIERSLETTSEENLAMTSETVAFLQDHGLEVMVDLEHAVDAWWGRREMGAPCDHDYAQRTLDYFRRLVGQCEQQQVTRIAVCDTTGGASPEEVSITIAGLVRDFPSAKFGFHGHTDRGLGVANARAAVLAGAVQIQGTLVGTGERCGNINLTTVIGGMQLRGEAQFVPDDALNGLVSLSHATYAAFGLDVPHGAPIAGLGAFGTWAGMHGSSERKNPGAYLWCDPASVGTAPAIGVNAQSGRANVMMLSETLGVALNSTQAQVFLDANHAMVEAGGFAASEESFRLACMRVLGTLPDFFNIRTWRVMDESDEAGTRFVQAFMSLAVGNGAIATTRAEGAGPVDALTRAMRNELEKWYPILKRMHLGRFSVTALDISAHDSAAHVRVSVSFQAEGYEPWVTAGVSSDLNQAALMAIVDGFQSWLLRSAEAITIESSAEQITAAPQTDHLLYSEGSPAEVAKLADAQA